MKLDAQKVILLYFLSLWRVDQEIIVAAIKQIVLQLLIEQYFKHCVHHWHKLHFIISRRLDFCVFHQYHYSNFVTNFSPAEVYPQGSWSSVEACSTQELNQNLKCKGTRWWQKKKKSNNTNVGGVLEPPNSHSGFQTGSQLENWRLLSILGWFFLFKRTSDLGFHTKFFLRFSSCGFEPNSSNFLTLWLLFWARFKNWVQIHLHITYTWNITKTFPTKQKR